MVDAGVANLSPPDLSRIRKGPYPLKRGVTDKEWLETYQLFVDLALLTAEEYEPEDYQLLACYDIAHYEWCLRRRDKWLEHFINAFINGWATSMKTAGGMKDFIETGIVHSKALSLRRTSVI